MRRDCGVVECQGDGRTDDEEWQAGTVRDCADNSIRGTCCHASISRTRVHGNDRKMPCHIIMTNNLIRNAALIYVVPV